ncbi:hypothetical protein K438DRAFT_1990391 [Mycena galopus ATCC 62051]|nr:hypothetical protein K438DRAFT_1990391 [Mycena galopus ATCC 62051]
MPAAPAPVSARSPNVVSAPTPNARRRRIGSDLKLTPARPAAHAHDARLQRGRDDHRAVLLLRVHPVLPLIRLLRPAHARLLQLRVCQNVWSAAAESLGSALGLYDPNTIGQPPSPRMRPIHHVLPAPLPLPHLLPAVPINKRHHRLVHLPIIPDILVPPHVRAYRPRERHAHPLYVFSMGAGKMRWVCEPFLDGFVSTSSLAKPH